MIRCQRESGATKAAKALFMFCTFDCHAARILLRVDIIDALQREIQRDNSIASESLSSSETIFLYCELCTAAEQVTRFAQYMQPIQRLLSPTLRDRFLANLDAECEALVRASTYALVHLHALSGAFQSSPALLDALPQQRSASRCHQPLRNERICPVPCSACRPRRSRRPRPATPARAGTAWWSFARTPSASSIGACGAACVCARVSSRRACACRG